MDDETIRELREDLSNYPKKKVDSFLAELSLLCDIKDHLSSAAYIAGHRRNLAFIRRHFEKAQTHLKEIRKKKFNILPQKKFNDTEGEKAATHLDIGIASMDAAVEAFLSIDKLLDIIRSAEKMLKSEKPKRGRERADAQGIYTEAKKIFEKHLGRPTSYDSGPFVKVMTVITGQADVRRGVRQVTKPTK